MKKLVLSALVLAGLGLASCEKEQSTPAAPGMATVTLNVMANYDMTNDTMYNGAFEMQEEKLDGIDVEFIVNSRDLQENPVSGFNYDELIYTGTVTNGVVTVELPAAKDAHSVDVKFSDVELQEKTEFVSTVSGNDTTKVETVIYTKSNMTVSIWDGATVIKDVTYN